MEKKITEATIEEAHRALFEVKPYDGPDFSAEELHEVCESLFVGGIEASVEDVDVEAISRRLFG